MPYPSNLLTPTETKILDLRPHWWFFGRQILTGAPLFGLTIIFFLMDPGAPTTILGRILMLLAAPWIVWMVFKYFSWTRTYFVVTNQRVIFRTGIISRKGVEIPLERIMNLNFEQRVFERIIGVGNLEVQSAGEQGTSTFNFVSHPDDVKRTIYTEMENRDRHQDRQHAEAMGTVMAEKLEQEYNEQKTSGQKNTLADSTAIFEQIKQLAELRDSGILSEEEFLSKKADLLGRL